MDVSADATAAAAAAGDAAGASTTHICATPGCTKEAKMACPTCLKLGLPPTRFCDQECFKGSWAVHKLMHKKKEDLAKLPPEFRGFMFTGPLRPYQQSPKRTVPPGIMRPDYADHPNGWPLSEQEDKRTGSQMKVYTKAEIDGIRAACRIGREVLDLAGNAVKAGVTCDELDRIVHDATVERGAYPSPLNYHMFPKSVCTSVNEVICHGIPDYRELQVRSYPSPCPSRLPALLSCSSVRTTYIHRVPLLRACVVGNGNQDGDIVNIDVSVYYNGFHGDLNETFLVGNVDAQSRGLVEVAFKSLQAAIATVKV